MKTGPERKTDNIGEIDKGNRIMKHVPGKKGDYL